MGSVYADRKCACKGTFEHIEGKGLFCRNCSKVFTPTSLKAKQHIVRFGEKTSKRFRTYHEAYVFLGGLKFESEKGTYDHRDWRADHPLGFETQALKYVKAKKPPKVGESQYRNIKRDIYKAINAWGQRNIKTIKYAEIEDFLNGLPVAPKTKANTKSVLSDFFTWLNKREGLPIPEMPEIKYQLGWRNIVDIEDQEKIIAEVYRISYHINPRIWIGIKWLSTYVGIRPKEMRNLKERHIKINGCFVIPDPKEKDPKIITMLEEDIEIYKSMPKGLPDLYFFRHIEVKGVEGRGIIAGKHFGKDYFWLWWKKACKNLGIEGVDLYGGTRHSTTTALGEHFTKDELKGSGTFHKTNKAFERYMQNKHNESKKVYAKVQELKGKAKVVDFKKKKKNDK